MAVTLLLVLATLGGGLANERDHRAVQQLQGVGTVMVGNGVFRPVYGPSPYDVLLRTASSDSATEPAPSPDLRAQRPAQQPRGVAVDGPTLHAPEESDMSMWQAGDPSSASADQDRTSRGDESGVPMVRDLPCGGTCQDGGSGGSEPAGAEVDAASVPAPTATVEPTATPRADTPTSPTASAQPSQDADAVFSMGYIAQGGPTALLAHFINDVGPCEGGPTYRDDYGNGYRTRFQFSADTWATISAAIGPLDGTNPYDVGRAVAWWINAIGAANIATRSGWPVCGR